nr:rna polymerase ii-associated protein 1 like [Quercus suber]
MLVERKEKSHDGKVKVMKVTSQYSRLGMTVKSPRARPAIMLSVERCGRRASEPKTLAVAVVVVAVVAAATVVAGVTSGGEGGAAGDEDRAAETEWVRMEMTASRRSFASEACGSGSNSGPGMAHVCGSCLRLVEDQTWPRRITGARCRRQLKSAGACDAVPRLYPQSGTPDCGNTSVGRCTTSSFRLTTACSTIAPSPLRQSRYQPRRSRERRITLVRRYLALSPLNWPPSASRPTNHTMASSQRAVVHQDYIARIRYSNALPPPPNPPKLLDIPGTGLAGGQYTSAGYASRLAREQPLNIEADAELGMPIDLVGIPGVFDGDDSALSTRQGAWVHPADRALLKPLSSLGKANAAANGVSFLRRTEYISSSNPQHFSSSTSKDLLRLKGDAKRRKINADKEDPINILRNIVKGFDIAYPQDAYQGQDSTSAIRGAPVTDNESRAWSNPKHPSNPKLQLLDSYPVLPDLDALPASGFFTIVKFTSNPTPQGEVYDARLDAAILRPVSNEQADARFQRQLEEWDPSSGKQRPIPEYEYEYFLPDSTAAMRNFKRKYNVNDPARDSPGLYTDGHTNDAAAADDDDDDDDNAGSGTARNFKFSRLRRYETYRQAGNADNAYNENVVLALHDADLDNANARGRTAPRLKKGAYLYPVVQTTHLRAKRAVAARPDVEPERVDALAVTVGPADDVEARRRLTVRAALDPRVDLPDDVDAEAEAEADAAAGEVAA